MGRRKYLNAEDLVYSCIFGNGIYTADGQSVQDPLGVDGEVHGISPLFRNITTGEEFFAKRVNYDGALRRGDLERFLERYRNLILNPPSRKHLLCPSDLICLPVEFASLCSLLVAREYSEIVMPTKAVEGNFAVLFPYGGYPGMRNGAHRLKEIKCVSWQNPEIRKMAAQIVSALEDINRSGYIYCDMHLSRFFFTDEGSAYLDFSNLLFPIRDSRRNVEDTGRVAEGGFYPIEFASPAIVQGIRRTFDFQLQNYSLCALLFYLFFGQFSYDGRLLTGYVDDSIQKHYIKFRDYHKMPVFIFDPDDHQNALGAFDEEQQVIDSWNALPEPLSQIFISVLGRENALCQCKYENPTPSMWLRCFRELGWLETPKEGGK